VNRPPALGRGPENAVASVPPARVVFEEKDRREVLELIEGALRTGVLTLGPLGERLEEELARCHGVRFAVATSSGTSALEIVLRSIGVAGREVVVPANTFYATAAAVLHAGARPRFADIDSATMALSGSTLEAALTDSVGAVICVHLGGAIDPDICAIHKLCEARGVALIEDAAHAHGSTLDGQPAGSWSLAATLSFYPTKVVAGAEGGMILTDSDSLRDEARIYRDQGKASFAGGEHVRLGSAWRMSELQAAVVLVQLSRLGEHVDRRRALARRYDEALSALEGISPLGEPEGSCGNYYKYIALLDPGIDRRALRAEMAGRYRVHLAGEVYPRPLHLEPVFAELAPAGGLPVAEDLCARHVCLPLFSDMTDDEQARVVEALEGALASLGSKPK
jgi:perosamine synthetase